MWPSLGQEPPDIFVSLGTSYNAATSQYQEEGRAQRRDFFSYAKSSANTAIDHAAQALDSEKAWHAYMSVISPPPIHRTKYYRINPQLQQPPPRLDDIYSMQNIKDQTRDLLEPSTIARLASHLIASSFYFEIYRTETSKDTDDHTVHCKGR